MVRDRALKAAIRKEMERTGESYNVVRLRFRKAQAQLMGLTSDLDHTCPHGYDTRTATCGYCEE
jgi:hypothetical protein